MIAEAIAIALVGHRQRRALAEEGGDGVGDRGMICDGEGARVQHHAFRRNQAETGVGGADVSDEPSLDIAAARAHAQALDSVPRAGKTRPIRVSVSKASVVRRTSSGCRV